MILWLVTQYWDYEDLTFIGVFTSYDKAFQCMKCFVQESSSGVSNTNWRKTRFGFRDDNNATALIVRQIKADEY